MEQKAISNSQRLVSPLDKADLDRPQSLKRVSSPLDRQLLPRESTDDIKVEVKSHVSDTQQLNKQNIRRSASLNDTQDPD